MSRKTLSKSLRNQVKEKYGGRCAYCGEELGDRWHLDHATPVALTHMHRDMDVNGLGNLMPSCFACNNYKGVYDVEGFRAVLNDQIRMARSYSVNFRFAERFGLIQVIQKPVRFYFEKDTP